MAEIDVPTEYVYVQELERSAKESTEQGGDRDTLQTYFFFW